MTRTNGGTARGGRPVVVGVVPARWGSRRWPGKVLATVAGRPLIGWAWESLCAAPEIGRAVIATDDARIADWAAAYGAPVVLTSPACRNGTERVAEVAEKYPADLYVNIQADQVALEPRIVSRLVRALAAHPAWPMATPATRDGLAAARTNPDRVLVAPRDDNGNGDGVAHGYGVASWFRRGGSDLPPGDGLRRHLGAYAYRSDALRAYRDAPPAAEEIALGLEQCRALALGWEIGLIFVRSRAKSCDRPEDSRVEGWLASGASRTSSERSLNNAAILSEAKDLRTFRSPSRE